MSTLYPLRFHPILKRYVWGGRRLESLGKELGQEGDYAESWEVVDRTADQSVVAAGPLAGWTLGQLVQEHGRALLGRHGDGVARFPLLMKFLDAQDRLSLQVHPNDAQGALLDPPDLGKTEAWVILAAEPGSHLYAGLRPGVDREALVRQLERHACHECLERIEPAAGDCFFLPAGVVHALGAGLLVAEIQQASDTTYRLHDWNRLGADGRPRPLHVQAALEVIDYDYGPVARQVPQPTDRPEVERLVACDKFVLDRWRLSGLPTKAGVGGDERCHILAVLEGAIEVAGDSAGPLVAGSVALLPAALDEADVRWHGNTVFLDAYLP